MPEDLDNDLEDPEEPKPGTSNWRRQLEQDRDTARAEAARLKRENAIYRAGLTGLSDRQISVIASQIEGDPTVDGVKSIAQELGWLAAPADDGPSPSEQAHDQVGAALSGASPTNVDPFAVLDGIDNEEAFWKQAEANGLTK